MEFWQTDGVAQWNRAKRRAAARGGQAIIIADASGRGGGGLDSIRYYGTPIIPILATGGYTISEPTDDEPRWRIAKDRLLSDFRNTMSQSVLGIYEGCAHAKILNEQIRNYDPDRKTARREPEKHDDLLWATIYANFYSRYHRWHENTEEFYLPTEANYS